MRTFIQIVDFELPHNTGLVFEVNFETEERFWVKDIISSFDNSVLFGGGWRRDACVELTNPFANYDAFIKYCEILLERTQVILEFQKDK